MIMKIDEKIIGIVDDLSLAARYLNEYQVKKRSDSRPSAIEGTVSTILLSVETRNLPSHMEPIVMDILNKKISTIYDEIENELVGYCHEFIDSYDFVVSKNVDAIEDEK